MLRLIVIGVLLFRLTPVGGEMAEALLSMISDGGAVDSHPDAPDCEHGCNGCSALVHHCGCCSNFGDIRAVGIALAPPIQMPRAEFLLSSPQLGPDPQLLLRPPAA